MTTNEGTLSTQKVRRDIAGGKRGDGNRRGRRRRRGDPFAVKVGKPDKTLTGVAGLVFFARVLHELGVDRELRETFARLKRGRMVIYPMELQLRTLIDLFVVGEHRVFAVEALSADPLFVQLAGGCVASLDTYYRDLERFDDEGIEALDTLVGKQACAELARTGPSCVHLDIDSSVVPVYGDGIEGAVPGYNPTKHGRPSYHPLIARAAEIDMVVGAQLRPGNTTFGAADVPFVERMIDRVREAVGPKCIIRVRIDAAGDCTELLSALDAKGVYYVTKADITPDLYCALASHDEAKWKTVDRDAFDQPTWQTTEVAFRRDAWDKREPKLSVRAVAVRSTERDCGKQVYAWPGLDFAVQVFLTNDPTTDIDDLARDYNARAGIEPLIGELKNAWGIGAVSTESFAANHALLLIKLLSHNLLRRYVRARVPKLSKWRAAWIRRTLICVPGRLTRHGRGLTLRTRPSPVFRQLQ